MTEPSHPLIVNLTPHTVVLIRDGQEIARFESEGVARVDSTDVAVRPIEASGTVIDIATIATGAVCGLGPPTPGVIYVVSRLTAAALPERPDLVFPDDEVRDDSNQIVGCRRFARFDSTISTTEE